MFRFRRNNNEVKGVVIRCCLLAFALCLPAANAQLPDPTKPPRPTQQLAPPEPLPEVNKSEEQPTRRAAAPVRKPKPLRINSILTGDTRKLAVINGAVVRVGQRVSGATVVSIAKSGVMVRRGGRNQLLRLNNVTVKRRASQ